MASCTNHGLARQGRARRNAVSVAATAPCAPASAPASMTTTLQEVLVCPYADERGVGGMPRQCVAPDAVEEGALKSTLAQFSFGEDAVRREFRLVGGRWRPDREGGLRRVWCAHCAGVRKV